eukprot:TRINITY_DN7361_c0_g1_i3.p1 TRINITY_DN7361_c0_g1~~TRINITY_DN7361_c0_g1_i3.p1  ORF type:complete len:111 (+),score=24.54 TRINITY_DN7361_c0_g1_i3:277-609(+)
MTKPATVAASDDVEPPAKRIRHTLTPRTLSFVFDSPDCNRVLLITCLPRENGTCSVWTATSNFDGAGKLLKLSFREPLEKERGNAVVEKSSAEVRSNHISELPASSVWDF